MKKEGRKVVMDLEHRMKEYPWPGLIKDHLSPELNLSQEDRKFLNRLIDLMQISNIPCPHAKNIYLPKEARQ